MDKHKTSHNLIMALLESWNDNNITDQLNPELINLITGTINMAYVCGADELSSMLLGKLETDQSTCSQISREYIRGLIMHHQP